tara:strand:+ start:39413 stop:39592 length:180 start_codon:yes stop_codon:yes gene_type:complete
MTELFPSQIEIDSASGESAKSKKETEETKKYAESVIAHSFQPESSEPEATEKRQKLRLR